MPNKSQTGDSSFGARGLGGANNDPATGFIRTEQELKRQTPLIAPTAGKWTMPNGIMHLPDRRRRGGGGGTHPWKITIGAHEPGSQAEAKITEFGRVTYYNQPNSTRPSGSSSWTVDDNTILQIRVRTAKVDGAVTYKLEAVTSQSSPRWDDWSSFTVNENGDVDFLYPLAEFYRSYNGLIEVHQLARNNLQTVEGCSNGYNAKYIIPI